MQWTHDCICKLIPIGPDGPLTLRNEKYKFSSQSLNCLFLEYYIIFNDTTFSVSLLIWSFCLCAAYLK